MKTATQVIAALRSGGTQRFHTHAGRLIKTQDVAQHAYNVTLLVQALTFNRARRELLWAALTHDAAEHWVGDVPAPTKRSLEIRQLLANYEADALLRETGIEAPKLLPWEDRVLKIADSLEGAFFCAREILMGNQLARGVGRNFLSYIDDTLKDEVLIAVGDVVDFDNRLCSELISYAKDAIYE